MSDVAPTLRVLVVDDEPVLRGVLREILEIEGYAVVEASGRESALRACRENAIDAAVLDVSLPSIPGPQLLAKLREIRPGLPAVFISGHPASDIDGIDGEGFLQKPLDRHALLNELRRRIGDRG